MSRAHNFFRGVSSSYVAMAANIVYSFASVPLALHYLSTVECGLWVLVSQVANYFSLLDLGMTDSVSRNLIDHKDDRDGGQYGAIIQTSVLVALVQGFIITLTASLITPLATHLVLPASVSAVQVAQFQTLILAQCVLLGIGFPLRIFGVVMYAHQRSDVANFVQAAQLILMLVVLWIGFVLSWGLYAQLAALIFGTFFSLSALVIVSIQFDFFPKKGCWGRPNMSIFRELFSYGKDVFLIGLGWQLLNASQVIIVTRVMGLEAAFVWNTCTKVFSLAQQLVWRIHDFSHAPFSEMYVRGESERLRNRFKDTLILTGSSAVVVGVIGAACNSDFIHLWTKGRIFWSPLNDVAMGILVMANSIDRVHTGMVGITKQIHFTRFLYFVEGAVFVVTAYFAALYMGFMGIILCAIFCDVAFIGGYGLYRSKLLFKASYREMTLGWLQAPLRFGMAFSVYAVIVSLLVHSFQPNIRLFVTASLLTIASVPLFWILGLTPPIKLEISRFGRKLATRLPVKFRPTAV